MDVPQWPEQCKRFDEQENEGKWFKRGNWETTIHTLPAGYHCMWSRRLSHSNSN